MNDYNKIDEPFLVHETNFAEAEKVVYPVRPEKILLIKMQQWNHVTIYNGVM